MNSASMLLPRKNTLSAQVTHYLFDLIERRRLRPGDLAPSELQISRELNVSRGIVREAYRSLATLGILNIEAGKSPRVQDLNLSVLTQIIGFGLRVAHVEPAQVLQLRRAVEIECAQLAAQHGTAAQFKALRAYLTEMYSGAEDIERIVAADVGLHTTLAEATQNPMFSLILEGLRGPLEDSMVQGLMSRRTREEVLQVPAAHEAIVESVCARDPSRAAEAMAHHFDLSVSAILAAGVDKGRGPRVAVRRR